jgi:hypothetical protein
MTHQVDLVPKYNYIIASVKDGTFKTEIPFNNVSWERKINGSGSFSGSISADLNQNHFGLYDYTLPGKYAIYVFRDGTLVWGGIIWTRDYNVNTKELNVTALEFTSYLFHRIFWKTLYFNDGTTVKALLESLISNTTNDELNVGNPFSASDTHILPTYYAQNNGTVGVAGNIVTFTTEEVHGFTNNALVLISGTQYDDWNGVRQINTVVGNDRAFTFISNNNGGGSAVSRSLVNTAFSVDGPQYAILKSTYDTIQNAVDVNLSYEIDPALAQYQIVGTGDDNPFEFRGHKFHYVGEILNNFAQNGVPSITTVSPTSASYAKIALTGTPSTAKRIVSKKVTSTVVTITTAQPHGFSAGNSITISNLDSVLNGTYSPITAVTTYTLSFAKTTANIEETYVKTIFTSVRFDYYVEPSYNASTGVFSNTFRAWKVKTDTNKPSGDSTDGANLTSLTGPSYTFSSTYYGSETVPAGANNFIFEHPGNIISLSLDENAEAAASRTWVVDSGTDLDANAAPPYGSYTNLAYLVDGYPMLDVAVTDRNLPVAIDEEIIPYAKQIGYRLAPPIGDYKITVNGSLQPEVNTYRPGDWCIIIPNDAFINNRLKPPYENRTGLLVRKIKSYKVSVPDNPTFPETVDLEVVPEWEIE